ncbi:hypothetical protein JAAARDRAFT_28095 [Jaapia argillacea MUCL 33604]|uniref:Coenzyme Q-binding protein COQ10 START domain-containing protein n=1 Tax=Jaapia argillacea MUCL 33604 TaxID=933084 RepID=A0A067QC06_9AGAM|nr:hypothetical protein JAAARDRAFT_28095 [Jaapia argillacea MUCL 33604]
MSPPRRSLFSLPDLSSLSPFSSNSGETQTYHERKILPYKRSQLYQVVADVGSYPRFLPFCTDSRILQNSPSPSITTERQPSSVSVMEAELTVGFLSFKESYISQVTCRPDESVEAVASSSTPLFKDLVTTWRFQDASPQSPHPSTRLPTPSSQNSSNLSDEGPTLVTLDLAYAFANPVHATVSAAFFGQVSKLMVKAFEERCRELYGPGDR